MATVSDLYQAIILEHSKHPRHYGALPAATHSSEGYNPLCGDQVEVFLNLVGDRIESLRFEAAACAITKASASMMTSDLKGKTLDEAQHSLRHLKTMIETDRTQAIVAQPEDPLAALAEVRQFPARIACAMLPWETLMKALDAPLAQRGPNSIKASAEDQ